MGNPRDPNSIKHIMEYLGFDRRTYAVYEGNFMGGGYRALPPPPLAPIRFVRDKKLTAVAPWADGLAPEIFREDDFDSVTKIRRGRVFQMRNCSQPYKWKVNDSYDRDVLQLMTYERTLLPDLANLTAYQLPTVALGWEPHVTFWKIVSLECNLVGTPVLTLKAKHSLGDTPELLKNKVPTETLVPLREALESVEASVNRLAPVDVIDRCRGALSIAFGYQIGDPGKDLGQSINAYLRKAGESDENLPARCGRIVARLHSRGKPNEQAGKGLRPPTESDADLALNCLKTVLIEFGWAR